MRKLMICLSLLAIFLGCEAKKEVEETTEKYADTIVKTMNKAQKMKYVLGVKQLVDAYKVENGKYPASLKDLKDVSKPPNGWIWKYDNKTGKVDIVKKK